MRTRLVLILFLALPLLPATVSADLKFFSRDSLAQITESRTGQPFLLVLWSIDCPPCIKELSHLQKLRHQFRQDELVLISTDGPANREAVEQTLAEFDLNRFENRIFAHSFAERLRYRIDPDWFGELPRSYRYDAGHRRTGSSGALTPETLRQWLQQHTAAKTAP